MSDKVKIAYAMLAAMTDHINNEKNEEKFAIIEPLVSIGFYSLPAVLKARAVFAILNSKAGNKYELSINAFNPDGELIWNRSLSYEPSNDIEEKSATTVANDVTIDVIKEGIYRFEFNVLDHASRDYELFISKEGIKE